MPAGPGSGRTPIRVRAGARAEIRHVLTLWSSAEAEPTVTDDEAGLIALLSQDPEALLVAETGATVVGALVATWDGWRGHLYRLAVLPSHRRSGVASALVEAAEDRFRSLGARRLNAVVVEDQGWATGFWTAAGYTAQANRVRFVKNL